MTLCNAPVPAPHAHEIGDRKITVALTVNWGDARDINEKELVFCSFKCLADWAAGRAAEQDGRVVK